MKRLLRPAIVIPLVAVLLFAAGVVYAVTTGLDEDAEDTLKIEIRAGAATWA